jgi:hypothetical protein
MLCAAATADGLWRGHWLLDGWPSPGDRDPTQSGYSGLNKKILETAIMKRPSFRRAACG